MLAEWKILCFLLKSHLSLGVFSKKKLQVSSQYREAIENVNIDEILLKFAEDKGTGRERPGMKILIFLDFVNERQ